MSKPVTDETRITFGKHKGSRMCDIPEEYLIWWYNENIEMILYIQDNIDDSKL